jgi:Tol biopolymer transport system component
LLFSEIKTGIHMALVTGTESRTESRDVYVPESIRGMAHRSYLSPSGEQVLVTEMDNGGIGPCRLIPFDGSSPGRIVGPSSGQCTHAAWSPDGHWMFFTTSASGSFQIWRQRFPDGKPEQLTSGPTQAEGLGMAPDGQSVITSIGLAQSSVWVAAGAAERQISTEGNADFPAWGDGFPTSVFSPDGQKLYYLVQAGVQHGFGGGELWVADLVAGSNERLLPAIAVNSYDISADGQQAVFSSFDSTGKSRIWLARLDRRSSPIQLAPAEALGPAFGRDGDVYFRSYENNRGYLYVLKLDSGQVRKFSEYEALNSPIVSPDGQWIVSWTPLSVNSSSAIVKAYPRNGGAAITVCPSCFLKWSRDQKFLFLSPNAVGEAGETGRTFVIALEPGHALPRLPPSGVATEAQVRKLAVARVIERGIVFPGATGSVYAFPRSFVQRNLYRVTLPQ